MTELIKIEQNESGDKLVSARELWKFLGVKTNFTTWFNMMLDYGFGENEDYLVFKNENLENTGFGAKLLTKWTQKGRLFMHGLLENLGYIALIDRDD